MKYLFSFICVASIASLFRASPLRNGASKEAREMDEDVSLLERFLRREIQEELRNVDDEHASFENTYRGVKDARVYSRNLFDEEIPRPKRTETVHATEFLEKFGYLPVMEEGVQHDQAARTGAIKRFQKMYHIPQTGALDKKTVKMMAAPRCGMPDAVPEEYLEEPMAPQKQTQQLLANNFVVPGNKWSKLDLTWNLKNFTNKLPQETQKAAIRRAFRYWSDASGLTFQEVSGKGDLNLHFVKRTHGDGIQNSFDGSSGVLAHAFYPNAGAQTGQCHFDDEENWTDNEDVGINLMIVAAHELGHAMGLAHSDVQGALMAPYYQGFAPNYMLPKDDVMAIQSLYGTNNNNAVVPEPETTTTTTTTTTKTPDIPLPAGAPDTCTVAFKAATQTHDHRIYVFNGKWMWRMSEYGLDTGFPITIKTYYESAPDSIDTVIFSWKTYFTYMFKGNKIWRYYGFQLDEMKTVSTTGYPTSPKAALAGSDGVICLYKGGSCWTFDEEKMDVTSATPTSFQELLPGSPSGFDSVIRILDDPYIYFFKGNNYYKYDPASKNILPGYPKGKNGPWMGPACGAEPYTPK